MRNSEQAMEPVGKKLNKILRETRRANRKSARMRRCLDNLERSYAREFGKSGKWERADKINVPAQTYSDRFLDKLKRPSIFIPFVLSIVTLSILLGFFGERAYLYIKAMVVS